MLLLSLGHCGAERWGRHETENLVGRGRLLPTDTHRTHKRLAELERLLVRCLVCKTTYVRIMGEQGSR